MDNFNCPFCNKGDLKALRPVLYKEIIYKCTNCKTELRSKLVDGKYKYYIHWKNIRLNPDVYTAYENRYFNISELINNAYINVDLSKKIKHENTKSNIAYIPPNKNSHSLIKIIGLIFILMMGFWYVDESRILSEGFELLLGSYSNSDNYNHYSGDEEDWHEKGNYITDFSWEYGGYDWTWQLTIPKSTYNYYRQKDRYSYNQVRKYITRDNSGYIEVICEKLVECANSQGFSEYETVYFVISFVQGMPYYWDDISTGKDDWPKFPVETLADGGGDCEDTSILVAGLLHEMGYGVVLFMVDDNHMAVGVLGGENTYGTYVEHNGNKYFYLETTNIGWEIGEIPDEYKNAPFIVYDI